MQTFYSLSVFLANNHCALCNSFVCRVAICVNNFYFKVKIEEIAQLIQIRMFSGAKPKGQNVARVVINGPPQPVLLGFVVNKAPNLIRLSFSNINDYYF